jgi:hypothetical protein
MAWSPNCLIPYQATLSPSKGPWRGRRGEVLMRGDGLLRRLRRAMRSADPLPLNSRNAPPTAFATPPGLGRIGENEPPSGWDSKLVVPVRECYRWSLHCSFLARPCALSDRDTGTTCSGIRRCAQNHAGKHAERLPVNRARYLAESAAFHAKQHSWSACFRPSRSLGFANPSSQDRSTRTSATGAGAGPRRSRGGYISKESPTGEVIQCWVSPSSPAKVERRNRPIQIKAFEC